MSRHRPTFALRLSLALRSLTAVFGMGTGVAFSQEVPRYCTQFNFKVFLIKTIVQAPLSALVVRSTD